MFKWVIAGRLAGGPRPRWKNKPLSQVSKSIVDAWIKKPKVATVFDPSFACSTIPNSGYTTHCQLISRLTIELMDYWWRIFRFVTTGIPPFLIASLEKFGRHISGWKSRS